MKYVCREVWQVGDPNSDHQCWERPEDMDTPRVTLQINASSPGSEVAAETAAALAAASLAIRGWRDSTYTNTLLDAAVTVTNHSQARHAPKSIHCSVSPVRYSLLNAYFCRLSILPTPTGAHSPALVPSTAPHLATWYVTRQLILCLDRVIHLSEPFELNTDGSCTQDELLWAAAWLYRASGDQRYLQFVLDNASSSGDMSEFSWDNKNAGVQVLLSKVSMHSLVRSMALCPVDTCSLSRPTDNLFMLALKED